MARKLTQEEFIKRILDYGLNITPLTEYNGKRNKVKMRCNVCNYEWEVLPGHILQGAGCPMCSKRKSYLKKCLPHEEFIKKIVPTIEVLNKYEGHNSILKCKCKKCNYEWEVKALYLINAKACPRCSNRLGQTENSLRDLINTNSPTITILEESVLNKDHLQCQCKICNHIWYPHIVALRRGLRCPKCTALESKINLMKPLELFILQSAEKHLNKYNYSKVEYKGVKEKVCIICPEHGEFWQLPSQHLLGCGCPICNSSKGELNVRKFLLKNNIEFISQYEISCPINKTNIAKIDFYLPKLNVAIEYNGEQHYVPKKFTGGEIEFKHQQERDEYVRNYCKEHNIKLIEIHFSYNTEDKIFQFLEKEIEKVII